ncbi:hypothetical protein TNCV_3750161 [Trichonephila clavipes]|nr:hypothetical protein TNCV_3750161 [Trichonephila clavipes]
MTGVTVITVVNARRRSQSTLLSLIGHYAKLALIIKCVKTPRWEAIATLSAIWKRLYRSFSIDPSTLDIVTEIDFSSNFQKHVYDRQHSRQVANIATKNDDKKKTFSQASIEPPI